MSSAVAATGHGEVKFIVIILAVGFFGCWILSEGFYT